MKRLPSLSRAGGAVLGIAACLAAASARDIPVKQEVAETLPASPRLLACDDSILSLASDGAHIYTGHIWGVGVRDAKGTLLRRWPLGLCVDHLAWCQGRLYAGTRAGLLQIQPESGAIERIGLNWGPLRPDGTKAGHGDPDENFEAIRALSASDRFVWAGTVHTLRRFDPADGSVRVYTRNSLGIGDSVAPYVEFVLADEKGAWVEAYCALLRFDGAGELVRCFRAGTGGLELCGIAEGEVWAVTETGPQGVRPVLLNPETGTVTDFRFGDSEAEDSAVPLSTLSLLGCTDGSDLVFVEKKGRRFVLRDGRMHDAGEGIAVHRFAIKKSPPNRDYARWVVDMDLIDDAPPDLSGNEWQRWIVERGPSGLFLMGASNLGIGSSIHFDNHANPREYRGWSTEDHVHGLWIRRADGDWDRTPPAVSPQSLPCDVIFSVSEILGNAWLCGPGGIVVATQDGTILKRYTMAEGLPTNRTYQAVELDGDVYVACGGTDKGDYRGSLAVLPLHAERFTSVPMKAVLTPELGDVLGVTTCGGELKLTFADSREVRGIEPTSYRARILNLKSSACRNASADEMKQGQAPPVNSLEGPLPLLGGLQMCRFTVGQYQWAAGSRGACIWSGKVPQAPMFPLLKFRHLADPSDDWADDNRLTKLKGASERELRGWLRDSNAILRARALGHLSVPTAEEVRAALSDAHVMVREAALWRVMQDRSSAALPLLRLAMADAEPSLRDYAVLGLLERGELPAMEHLRQTVANSDFRVLHSYNAKGSQRYAQEKDLWPALASVANLDVLLMMDQPRRTAHYDTVTYEALGKVLAAQPAGLEQLSIPIARDGQWSDVDAKFDFASRVTVAAGAPMLPTLHAWLKADNHVWRVFAAYACGEIHDDASLQHLLDAFKSDDGLALGAITIALGKLRDPVAIPALVKFFPEANKHDPMSSLWGMPPVWIRDERVRAKYSRPQAPEHSTLTYVRSASGEMVARQVHQPLLFLRDLPKGAVPVWPSHITGAIECIGPEHAQEYYLSALKESRSGFIELAVARGLRPVEGQDRDQQVAMLRAMLSRGAADSNFSYLAVEAAITLLHFGIHDGEPWILKTLSQGSDPGATMKRLLEVPRVERSFADETLRAWKASHREYVEEVRMVDLLLK